MMMFGCLFDEIKIYINVTLDLLLCLSPVFRLHPMSMSFKSRLIKLCINSHSVCGCAEPGAAFGEVALLTDNGTRSASIIADEPTDLIVIDRALYSRCVQVYGITDAYIMFNMINHWFHCNCTEGAHDKKALNLARQNSPKYAILRSQNKTICPFPDSSRTPSTLRSPNFQLALTPLCKPVTFLSYILGRKVP